MKSKTDFSAIPRIRTIKETAEATDIPYHTIRQWCVEGKVTYIKTGNKYLINLDRFIDFLNAGDPNGGGADAV